MAFRPQIGLGVHNRKRGGGITTIQNSILFDGVDELMSTALANIDVGVVSGANPEFALIAMFKTADANNTGDIFSLYDDATDRTLRLMGGTTTDRPRFRLYNNASAQKQVVPNSSVNSNNAWGHIVVNIKASTATGEFWFNGTDETTTNQIIAGTYGAGTMGTDWKIGEGNGVFLDGNVLQLALIKRVVTPAEIALLYNLGCPALIGDVIGAGDIEFLLEDNYSWSGSSIDGTNSMTSTNMEEADITTDTPC